ncbi:hypothetical protein Tcan_11466 [Toxocara canis]|uniref:Uncharacterized protein n=1 Tax=Toxocara canis TaxID=6265 RepID=A0A0B2V4Y4_TOXCA|nr:hypothetical protein Tcan_11466 [Toxocara canis]
MEEQYSRTLHMWEKTSQLDNIMTLICAGSCDGGRRLLCEEQRNFYQQIWLKSSNVTTIHGDFELV